MNAKLTLGSDHWFVAVIANLPTLIKEEENGLSTEADVPASNQLAEATRKRSGKAVVAKATGKRSRKAVTRREHPHRSILHEQHPRL